MMRKLRQRQPRVRDEDFLAFVRKQPCCVCGESGRSQAAHIRMACEALGKRKTGMQEKPDDRWIVPLCGPRFGYPLPHPGCHAEQHSGSEAKFWFLNRTDPFAIAMRLFAVYKAQRPEKVRDRRSETAVSKPKRRKQTHRRPAVATTRPKRKIASRPFPKAKRKFR